MKTLIEDFSVLAVEKCLLQQLPDLFSPRALIMFEDSLTAKVAGEADESKIERTETIQKLRILQTSLSAFRGLAQSQAFGTFPRHQFLSE